MGNTLNGTAIWEQEVMVRENEEAASEMLLLPSVNGDPRRGCDKRAGNCAMASGARAG